MKTLRILALCAVCVIYTAAFSQTRVIAHRGYWKCEGSAQNSITALRMAAEAKVYGSEFDVQMTKDGKAVINHDDAINGIRIADATYNELKNTRLRNGEKLPTLDEYLKAGKDLNGIRMILEIKPHRTKAEENKITDIVVKKVRKHKMEDRVEYISFSLNICERLVKRTNGANIAYLNGELAPKDLKDKGINGIDYHINVLKKHPEWVDKAHMLGMTVNVWTVDAPQEIADFAKAKVDFITTNEPVTALKIVEENGK